MRITHTQRVTAHCQAGQGQGHYSPELTINNVKFWQTRAVILHMPSSVVRLMRRKGFTEIGRMHTHIDTRTCTPTHLYRDSHTHVVTNT